MMGNGRGNRVRNLREPVAVGVRLAFTHRGSMRRDQQPIETAGAVEFDVNRRN